MVIACSVVLMGAVQCMLKVSRHMRGLRVSRIDPAEDRQAAVEVWILLIAL